MNNGQMIEETAKTHPAAESLRKIAATVSGREIKLEKAGGKFDILGWLRAHTSKISDAAREKEGMKPAKAKSAG